MSRLKRLNLLLLIVLVSGCSMFKPYVDRRREAGAPAKNLYVGLSTPQNPAICYNIWASDYDEVKKLADEECRKHNTGSQAQPVKQIILSCKLFTPNHFIFKCVGQTKKEKMYSPNDSEKIQGK